MTELICGRYRLRLDRPLLMGIVNLTPDSFSRDGCGSDVSHAVAYAQAQLEAGADILDLGAESSRPGAIPTTESEELSRLLPVLKEISDWGVPISIDTYKPNVMRAAIDAGASMINDIYALRCPGAMEAVRETECAICLMHMQGQPGTMQSAPTYKNVVEDVIGFLRANVRACEHAGIDSGRLVLDPGFGFGKTLQHNLDLFRALTVTGIAGLPVLVGVSRKTMIGQITGRDVSGRLAGSLAAALMAAQQGAKILRVHDVAATKDVLAVWSAIESGEGK